VRDSVEEGSLSIFSFAAVRCECESVIVEQDTMGLVSSSDGHTTKCPIKSGCPNKPTCRASKFDSALARARARARAEVVELWSGERLGGPCTRASRIVIFRDLGGAAPTRRLNCTFLAPHRETLKQLSCRRSPSSLAPVTKHASPQP
jgi:hypothetical protein